MVGDERVKRSLSGSKPDLLSLQQSPMKLVAPEGFEPTLLESESSILPIILRSNEIGGGCWVRTNSLLGLWGIFSTHECKARAYSQLGQNLTFQPQSKLANPRVTWLTTWKLSRPPRNFCDTTCSSFPWNMPVVLFRLNYPPLKSGRICFSEVTCVLPNHTRLAGFHFTYGMHNVAWRYMDVGSTAPWV